MCVSSPFVPEKSPIEETYSQWRRTELTTITISSTRWSWSETPASANPTSSLASPATSSASSPNPRSASSSPPEASASTKKSSRLRFGTPQVKKGTRNAHESQETRFFDFFFIFSQFLILIWFEESEPKPKLILDYVQRLIKTHFYVITVIKKL